MKVVSSFMANERRKGEKGYLKMLYCNVFNQKKSYGEKRKGGFLNKNLEYFFVDTKEFPLFLPPFPPFHTRPFPPREKPRKIRTPHED